MSDPKDPPSTLGGLPEIIIKGGTTPSSYDKQRAEEQRLTELGRAHQDKQMQAAQAGDQMTQDGFVSSRLHSLRLMDSDAPKLVFYYMLRDKTVWQECVGEILVSPEQEEFFVLVCPRCVERGESAARSQMLVRKSHRKWFLDTRKAGTLVRLVAWGTERWIRICGTVTCEEILRCSNFNCNWAVRIDDSKVWPA